MLIYSLIDLKFKNKYVSLILGILIIAYYYAIPSFGLPKIEVKPIQC